MNSRKIRLMANKLRIHSIKSTTAAGSGHPTTCMSCAEIMSVLFFSEINAEDEFVLSKGHAAPILWATFAEAGFVPAKELMNLRKITSNLEGHPTPRMPLIKVATGSLGQGLAAGVGMALAQRILKKGKTYVLLGDGEMAEGSVWESANCAAHYKLKNLVAIVDVNRLGQSQETMHGHHLKAYKKKFKAFGWEAVIINGHNVDMLLKTIKKAKKSKKPFAIIAKTVKGKGFSKVENKNGWHGKAFDKEMMKKAIKEIGPANVKLSSRYRHTKIAPRFKDFKINNYKKGEMLATRDAYGNALVNLGKKDRQVVVLDGDVKNSTRTEKFFETFPKRSFESFIAEQNMAGMAAGFSAMGMVPFIATFAAFLTRAYDFIRMAQYSFANIKYCGSHAGISIGQDGPSQMGLEDLSMFLAMPESLILYPCDAVSAENCVKLQAKHKGISYLRTTRAKTPVIYGNNEKFKIGGLKVLKKSARDRALVVAAGITLHEALKAHEKLKKKGIHIRLIDLYCVKPLAEKELIKNAKECKNKVIVVEDHYANGIGPAVSEVIGKIKHLYVKELPRSGKPEELLKKYGIDSTAIIKAVTR